MKRITLLISAAFLLLAGCTKEQLVEERSYAGSVNVVKATFESLTGDSATKAAVTDAGTFTWQNGDQAAFAVSNVSDSYIKGTNSSTSATASFELEESGNFSSSSWAIYPFDLTTEQTPASLKVKVPASRVWAIDQTNVAMYGTYADSKFSFFHMGGLVRIEVNNVPTNARKFVFKTSGYKINGEFAPVDISENKVIETVASNTESEQTYTLTWATAPSSTNKTVFYVPLPVGEYKNGFAFYLKDSEDNILFSKVGTTSQPVARKQLLLMPAINLVGGSIEPVEKAAVVQEVPAGHSGDFLLANSEKVLLKVNASDKNNDITLKYNGGELPTNLEIQVVGGKAFDKKISGVLPKTHVDFKQGEIAEVEMTTSASTFEIVYPAVISTKLTVTGGNVTIKGAKVAAIEVDKDAKADADGNPVKITMEKATVGSQEIVPEVVAPIVANADIKVAPAKDVEVYVAPAQGVMVTTEGGAEGEVVNVGNKPVMIGSKGYDDLAAAITEVSNGQTIKVTAAISDAKGITVLKNKQFTVDFGGFTYTCASDPAGSKGTKNQVFQLLKNSTITFKNGTINVKEDAKSQFRFIIQNYANLTLEDITLDGTNLAISDGRVNYTVSNNFGSVEFKGATTIKAAATKGVAFDVCKSNDNTNYPEPPTVTVNTTGTIEGQVEVTGGNLVVTSGTFTNSGEVLNVSSGKVTVNGGNFTAGNVAVWVEGTGEKTADVTLAGGTFTSQESTVVFRGENDQITITGGEYTSKDNAVIAGNGSNDRTNGNTVTISGGTFNGGIKTTGYIACGIYAPWKDNITVSGGTFNITNGAGVVARAGVVAINGGTFNCTGTTKGWVGDKRTELPCECLIFDNTTPRYPGWDENSKIVVNGGTFSDLSGVKYVADNATYTLGANVTNAAGMSLDTKKTFTVDFNNHTYTVNKPGAGSTNTQTQAFQLIEGQTITFKNGTIKAATENLNATATNGESPIKRFIQNYANLTLTNMTLDGTYINGNNSVVEFCNGTVSIDGSTNFTAKSGVASINVDSWKGLYPNGTAVTINTTGNVGKIHCYTEGSGSMTTKSSLTIKNGKNITIDDVSNGDVTISVEGGEVVFALKGEFSVGEAKKVHFSQGNLTYNVSTTNWAFYEHQYDCATDYDANLISLFTWGYNENTSIVPNGESYVTGHTSVPDEEHLLDPEAWESFSASEDWGSQIGDGKTWRTLTAAEWIYLFDTREASTVSGTNNARYAKATVGSKSGIILLPDKYEHPSGVAELANINNGEAGYKANSYDVTTWAAMEAAGAVFLPAADYREGYEVNYGNSFGSYWSSTACRETIAWCVEFDSTNSDVDPDNNYLYSDSDSERAYGCSVRLVTESN